MNFVSICSNSKLGTIVFRFACAVSWNFVRRCRISKQWCTYVWNRFVSSFLFVLFGIKSGATKERIFLVHVSRFLKTCATWSYFKATVYMSSESNRSVLCVLVVFDIFHFKLRAHPVDSRLSVLEKNARRGRISRQWYTRVRNRCCSFLFCSSYLLFRSSVDMVKMRALYPSFPLR